MISKSKYEIDVVIAKKIFLSANLGEVTSISSLGAGEYNAVYLVHVDKTQYVLKIAPLDKPNMQTYETNMMESEVYWYKKMKELTTIKVPNIYFVDFTKKIIPTNYFIMESIAGKQLDQMEFDEIRKKESIKELAKLASQIHEIKGSEYGYIQNKLYPDWYQAIKAMCQNLIEDAKRMGRKSKRGEKLLRYIDKYQDILVSVPSSMVNFDIWPANIIVNKKKDNLTYTWIDPERSFYGDRMFDFVCLEMGKDILDKDTSIEAYNLVSKVPLIITRNERIRYGIGLGYLALIMEVEKYYRYSIRHFGWWRNVFVYSLLYKDSFNILKKNK